MRSEARVVITNPTGLHARPAVKLARLAAAFDADIEVRAGEEGKWVRARSTAHLMKLKVRAQSTIHFRAEGDQAEDALSALIDFVQRDFDEGPAAASPEANEPSTDVAGDRGESAATTGDVAGPLGKSSWRSAQGSESAAATGDVAGGYPGHEAGEPPEARAEAPGAAASRERTVSAAAKTLEVRAAPISIGARGARTVAASEIAPAEPPIPSEEARFEERFVVPAGQAPGGRTVSAVVASPGLGIGGV